MEETNRSGVQIPPSPLGSRTKDLLVVSGSKQEFVKLEELSKNKLSGLITKLSKIKKRKYRNKKDRKYGNINRGFTDDELKKFFKCCKNEKCYLSFFLMSNLGLRVGEVVKIKVDDIDFMKSKIRISTEKSHTGDFLYLHKKVRKLLLFWVQKFHDEIQKHDGFILFSNNKFKKNKEPHISPNWLRKEFRNICYISDLNEWYGNSDDGNNEHMRRCNNRKLYRLTTHSLRHYYISRVYRNCRNPVHTQKLSRHREFKSTQVYIHTTGEELDETMKSVFEEEGIQSNNEEVQEFVKVYNMFQEMKKG